MAKNPLKKQHTIHMHNIYGDSEEVSDYYESETEQA